MTVLEAIQKSAEFLGKKNVESPRLQVELLLAHLLKMPRMKLYLNFERALAPTEIDSLARTCKTARPARTAPAYYRLNFILRIRNCRQSPRARAATGNGIARGRRLAISCFGGTVPQTQINDATRSARPPVLDFGTGTGCIAIALAAKCPNAKIVATDISADALALAKENAAKNNVAERIEFLQGDGFAVLMSGDEFREPNKSKQIGNLAPKFDLIISNPPYIPSAEIETLQPEVRDFDPRAALDGGVDGLDFYRKLAIEAKPFLKPDGKIMLEFGDGQAEAIHKDF